MTATQRAWRTLNRAALALAVLFAVAFAAPALAQDGKTYLTSGELLKRALDAFADHVGGPPRTSMVLIDPRIITVLTQNPTRPDGTDEWTISRFNYLFLDQDTISGPAPHLAEGAVPQALDSFFDIGEVRLEDLRKITDSAKDFARLEDPAQVTSIRIARSVTLPQRVYGPVQWRISLASSRENATVIIDAAGNILGGDLSGTIRAQRLDILARDDWPAAFAQEALIRAIGDGPLVHSLSIAAKSVTARAELPPNHNLLRDFTWSYSGLAQSRDIPNPLAAGVPAERMPFSLNEIDLAGLARVKAAALAALAPATGAIHGMTAEKAAAGGGFVLRWRVDVTTDDDRAGHVDIGLDGGVLSAEVAP
ncbi:MAG: hypothetical protein ABTQ31_13200 [Rhizobiaceae bacterium]